MQAIEGAAKYTMSGCVGRTQERSTGPKGLGL